MFFVNVNTVRMPVCKRSRLDPLGSPFWYSGDPTQLYIEGVTGPSQFYPGLHQDRVLNHITQLMAYHPQYQEPFSQTQDFVMQGEGPLPYDQRHFIALMAASRHQCTYLAEVETQEFLSCGGDKAWLQGLQFAPKKIRDLDDINQMLAHRPWMISKEHILRLTTGHYSWSLAEVVHAITILAHFHALSSFVFGCGISPQQQQQQQPQQPPPQQQQQQQQTRQTQVPQQQQQQQQSPSQPPAQQQQVSGGPRLSGSRESLKSGGSSPALSSSPTASPSHQGSPGSGGEVENLMRKMRTISESKSTQDITCEELARRFESEATESATIPTMHTTSHTNGHSNGIGGYLVRDNDLSRFVRDSTFSYQDFTRRGEVPEIPTFRIQDYSWDDHGYSLVNRLYNDVGKLLDKKFKVAYNMTYYTMGGKLNVDTSMFRRAVWNYIHCLFGIRHDDYDYREVNVLLDRNLKQYIKAVCCYPERVSKQHYESVMREFKYSEKVHVTLMILEARMQAELLYALRALMRHTT